MKYIVLKGDSLSKISNRYTTAGYSGAYLIAKANGIENPNLIRVGLVINIPDKIVRGSAELRSLAPPPQRSFKVMGFKPLELFFNYQSTSKAVIPKPSKSTKKKEAKKTTSLTYFTSTPGIPIDIYGMHALGLTISKAIKSNDTILDILGILTESTSASQKYNTIVNGVKRKFDMGLEVKTSSLKPTSSKQTNVTKYPSKVGDTIRVDERRYIIPESILLLGVKLGSRNRGSRTPFKTPGGLIPTYKPIVPFELGKWSHKDSEGNVNEFMGYDKNGNFKIGTLDKFGPGDTMTLVYYGWITNVPRDNKGNLLATTAGKDSRRKSPVIDGKHENGSNFRGGLLLMTGKHEKNPDWNLFGNVTGGAYILLGGDETKLVRGSTNNVISEIEGMLKRYKKPVKFYEVDNGSYNRGLRTYDGNYTEKDLEFYDSLNVTAAGGGHFFYITPDSYPAY